MTHVYESTAATLTLQRFAALDPAWPDTLAFSGGVLLARIHPRNDRTYGDEEVLARALAFIPPHTYPALPALDWEEERREGYLARLTIRTGNLTGPFGEEYTELLKTVLRLPVVELQP